MKAIFKVSLLLCAFVGGCQSLFDIDSDFVRTPLHDDTRVFYVDVPTAEEPDFNRLRLIRPYERRQGLEAGEADPHIVENGDPVTITVNRVVLPRYLFDTSPEDSRDEKTYDIAVVLDVAAEAGVDETSIAVFYQSGVKADTVLSFNDLVVYSQDTWDNRVPPYFRFRVFNVSNERNERTRELLEQVSNQSGVLTDIVGMPYAEPFLDIAARAGELVMAGENEMLVDFQFQLFSTSQTSQSGGMPLGLFRKGGMIIAGVPRELTRDFWVGRTFIYDQNGERILEASSDAVIDSPFLSATISTTASVVPNVVRRRSAEIFEMLRDDDALRNDFETVSDSLVRLDVALQLMRVRESFSSNPTIGTFTTFVEMVEAAPVGSGSNEISQSTNNWLLSTMRSVTGVRLTDASEYLAWIERCGTEHDFKSEERRFEPTDLTSEACRLGLPGE